MALSWLNPPYRALVVGINAYDAPNTLIPDLQGCVADARAIYDFLTQDLNMAATDIRLLTSPAPDTAHKATRANILAGLRDFLGDAPDGSELLFYYSGHGSYTKLAPDISFGDKQGETLVAADARVDGVLDILDRELRLIRAQLVHKQIRLTVIADSCFSGDVMRGDPEPVGTMIPRMVNEPHSPARSLASLLDNTVALSDLQALYSQDNDHTYSLVSGCLATQQSYEVPAGESRRGVMTTAFLNAIRAANAPITYAELGQLLPAFVTAKQLEKQTPNVTGDVERGVFGTATPKRPLPVFAVQSVNADSTVEIRSGLIAGVEEGSELQGYPDWSFATATGMWKVVEAKAHRAKAQTLEVVTVPQVGQPLLLVTRSNSPTVYFDPSAQKIQAAWYEDKKVGMPALVETKVANDATYVVKTEQGDYVAQRKDKEIRPSLRKSQQDPRAIYDLARQLNRVATYETFVARQPHPYETWDLLVNQPNGVLLTVEQLDWNGNVTPLLIEGTGALPAKARLRITLENQSDRDIWVALYLLDEPYFVAERVYPNDNNFHLLDGASRTVTWNNNEWGGGRIPLKLFISSQEIKAADAPKFPCGTRDTNRGSEGQRGLFVVKATSWGEDEGWATHHIPFGL